MVENVEDLGAELNVESLRNFLDVVVLEEREVQGGNSRSDQNVAACVAAKIEAPQISGCERSPQTRRSRVAVGAENAWLGAVGTAKHSVLM